jgi:hypothetical protein
VRNFLSCGVRNRIQLGASVWRFIEAVTCLLCTNMRSPVDHHYGSVSQSHVHYCTDSVDDSSPFLLVQRCRFSTSCMHFLNCSVYFVQKERMCRAKITHGVGLYLHGGADLIFFLIFLTLGEMMGHVYLSLLSPLNGT